jgi:hypothetical protein
LSPGFARIGRDRICSVPRRTGIETQASTSFLSYCPERRRIQESGVAGVQELQKGRADFGFWMVGRFSCSGLM